MIMKRTLNLLFFLILTCAVYVPAKEPQTPDVIYGKLFTDIQKSGIFPDSKTFTDAVPKKNPKNITKEYIRTLKNTTSGFSLIEYVEKNFSMPRQQTPDARATIKQEISEHIKALWPVLKREKDISTKGSSLLP